MAGAGGKRLTARQRAERLLDPGSLVETPTLDPEADPGVVAGHGTVDGRPVCVFSVPGPEVAVAAAGLRRAVVGVVDLASKVGCPLVGILDGGLTRAWQDEDGLGALGELCSRSVLASGVVPQLSLVMGACSGGGAHWAALTDFTLMVDGARLLVVEPDAVETATGQAVDADALGGAATHTERSGVAHFRAADDQECLELARELLSYLPSNNLDEPPAQPGAGVPLDVTDTDLALDSLVPDDLHAPYDMRSVMEAVVDDGELLAVHARYAPNVLCGLGRVDGRPVGVVANQPLELAGVLDAAAAEKAARFLRTCDAFHLPVVTFVDAGGFLADGDQEPLGRLRRDAKLLYAYAEATVAKVTVVVRRAYGGVYDVMGSRQLRADATFAWPTARIAVAGPQAAAVAAAGELADAPDPDARLAELVEEWGRRAAPDRAVAAGHLDGVIAPSATRRRVVQALRLLATKREALPPKKHGNIPL